MSDSVPKPAFEFEKDVFPPDVRALMEAPGETVVTLHAIEYMSVEQLVSIDQTWAQGHKEHFGYPLLWSAPLAPDVATRELHALLDGVDGWEGAIALCFLPRHSFSFDTDGGHYDLLVCYQCHNMCLYRNGNYVQSLHGTAMSSDGVEALVIAAGIRRWCDNPN